MMNYNITTLTIEMIRMKIPKTLLLIKNAVIGLSVGVTAFTITNAIFKNSMPNKKAKRYANQKR